MRGRRRRILAFVLSAALACSMMPFSASTVSAEEPAQEQDAEILTETGVIVPEDPGLPDNEELLDGYVMNILGLNSGISTLANYGDKVLNEQEKAIYDQLKASIAGVASNGGSTEFELVSDNSWTFTYEELGWSGWPETFTKEMRDQLLQKTGISIEKIIDALLVDCPYELYWYDKTDGASIRYSYQDNGQAIIFSIPTLIFSVAQGYQDSSMENCVDASGAQSAATAASKAQEIVTRYKAVSDYEKLLGYKNEICALTDYNEGAAENEDTPYGDPWQLIYVFDGDDATTVVCEGYSKAFQYLCDLTDFASDEIVCYTVTGDIRGAHMWNIVTMPDGQNYLVDVTNSDTRTVGQDGHLFLTGGEGSIDEGYTFGVGNGSLSYKYDDETISLYGKGDDSILKIASKSYDPGAALPISVTVDQSEVIYGTSFTVHITGDASKEVEIYNGTDLLAKTTLLNGESSVHINTLESGLKPAENQGDVSGSYPKSYELSARYADDTESQNVKVTVDYYYNDPNNPYGADGVTPTEDGWYNTAPVIKAPQSYEIAATADKDTDWVESIQLDDEGSGVMATYYLRNSMTGTITRRDSLYRIDKTAPTELIADVSVQDTSAIVTASAKDTLSGIKSYSLTYDKGGSAAPNIAHQGNGKFSITGMEPQKEYQFTLTVTDKADNTSSITVAVSTSGKLSLSGAVVTVKGTDGYVYDGTKKDVSKDNVSVTLNGATVPETEYEVSFGADLVSAGTVTVTVTAKDNSKKYTGTAEGSFEIAKRNVTITAQDQTITYGETIDEDMEQVKAVDLAEGDAVASVKLSADTSKVTDNGVITVADAKIQNAAKSDVTGNYNIAYKPGKLTVKKAQSSIGFADTYQTTKDYDTKPFAVPTEKELEIKGASYEDVVFAWYDSAGNTALQGAPVDAGTYVLKASIPDSENTMASSAEKQIKIEKVIISDPEQFTFPDWPERGYVYDGTAKEPAVVVWIDKEKTVQLPAEEYTVEYVNNVNAGYGAQVVIRNAENSRNSLFDDYTKLFSISPASTAIRLDIPETAVYGEDISLTAVLTGISETDMPEGSVTFTVGREEYTVDIVNGTAVLPAEKLSGIPAGDYTVTVSYPGEGNYAGAKAEGTLSVQKADPDVGTVTCANDVLYTSTSWKDVQLQMTGSAKGRLLLNETTLQAGTESYTWTFVPEDTDNYNSVTGSIELTVQAVTVDHIEVSGKLEQTEYVYGDTVNLAGVTVTAVYVNGDRKVLTDNEMEIRYEHGAFLWAGDTSVTVAYTEAGETHTAKIDGLTVSEKTVEEPDIRLAIPEGGYIYDGTEKEPAVTVYAGGLLIPDSEYTVTYENNVNAGEAKVIVADREGGNFIVNGTASFEIGKAAQAVLAVTGMPAGTISYGDVFTLQTSGGSGEGKVTWEVTEGTEFAAISEDGTVTVKGVGPVTVKAVKAADQNYAEAYAVWSFDAGKANPDVGDVSYNGETLYSTDDPTGVQLDKTGEAAGTLKLADGTVFEPDRTEYVWVFIPEDTEHYNEVSGTIDLAIQANPPAAMKITGTPDRSGYSYGDPFDPTGLTVEITYKNGLVRTIPASALGIVYEQGSFLAVGDESVTVTYAHDGEEVSAVITGLTVTEKKVADPTVELEKDTYIYDGTAKKPGVTVKDGSTVIPADEYTVTYTDNVSVGTASVTITDNEGGNYEIAEKTVTFRIVTKEQSGGQNGSQTGTGGDKAVKTGDSAGIMLWLMLAAVSGFSVAGAYAWRKRRRV
ncbi:MAG TPA: Ig-like domain repeat protein [Lachnoclostridium phocaeense]|uniref:Ig-like domain repeat protein n=1 Tax=Lachnoclostridium phocaeense TaxID=1871021 RepID=A0A921I0J3_9FIRM|nr:Ig-like domain repeat protein [Lachnoclostridium phocaeense]